MKIKATPCPPSPPPAPPPPLPPRSPPAPPPLPPPLQGLGFHHTQPKRNLDHLKTATQQEDLGDSIAFDGFILFPPVDNGFDLGEATLVFLTYNEAQVTLYPSHPTPARQGPALLCATPTPLQPRRNQSASNRGSRNSQGCQEQFSKCAGVGSGKGG